MFQPRRRESKVCSPECTTAVIVQTQQKYTAEQYMKAAELRLLGTSRKTITQQTGISMPALKKFFRLNSIKLTPEQYKHAISLRWANYEPIVDGKKRCCRCQEWLPLDAFVKDAKTKSGLYPSCRRCDHLRYVAVAEIVIARNTKYSVEHKAERKAWAHQRYIENPEPKKAQAAKWHAENPEAAKEIRDNYNARHPGRKRARTAAYRARLNAAMPKWLSIEQLDEMKRIYANCPKGYHVDHIIPIRGKDVQGMHVPWNLQYLTIEENLKKGNKVLDSE